MSRTYRVACDHHWARDDMDSKVCIRCRARAPIKEDDF